jgi:hypothetical protein
MLLRSLAVIALMSLVASADTLKLKSGRTVEGTYLGGDSRTVRMATGSNVETFEIRDIESLQFGGTPAASQPAATCGRILRPERSTAAAPATPAIVIPEGTAVVIRMIDAVNSETNKVGDSFRASVDEPIVIDGKEVVPRGADVTTKLAYAQESGKLRGQTVLTLALSTITVNGKELQVVSDEVRQESDSRGKETARNVGIGAAAGAVIGAIAGGGKGAAIGAGVGAGAGTAVQVFTKGEKVQIPSETRLTFLLQQQVKI